MNKYKKIWIGSLIVSLIMAVLIVFYYWTNSSYESIKFAPIYIMILAMIYVICQIIRRYFVRHQNWWDWLYYIGLSAMMLPVFFMTASNESVFQLLSDYGILFLLVPIVLDAKQLINGK